jgi:hypothetical protein
MIGRKRRWPTVHAVLSAVLVAVVLAATGCARPDSTGAGADRPDGPPSTADGRLTAADLAALIRLPASAPKGDDSCTPDDLRLSLTDADHAAGHRYARLIATNTSQHTCSLVGFPGLGFRGGWGTAFPLVAVQFVAGGPVGPLIVNSSDHVDLGQDTTVRIGPWGPAECSDVGAAEQCRQ